MGHNLTRPPGGGPDRPIEPLCLVVDDPSGTDHEGWPVASWRRRFPARLHAAPGS